MAEKKTYVVDLDKLTVDGYAVLASIEAPFTPATIAKMIPTLHEIVEGGVKHLHFSEINAIINAVTEALLDAAVAMRVAELEPQEGEDAA